MANKKNGSGTLAAELAFAVMISVVIFVNPEAVVQEDSEPKVDSTSIDLPLMTPSPASSQDKNASLTEPVTLEMIDGNLQVNGIKMATAEALQYLVKHSTNSVSVVMPPPLLELMNAANEKAIAITIQ